MLTEARVFVIAVIVAAAWYVFSFEHCVDDIENITGLSLLLQPRRERKIRQSKGASRRPSFPP